MCVLQDLGQAYPHNIKQRLGATSDAAIVHPQILPDSSLLSLYSTMYLSIHRSTLPFANAHALSQQLHCDNPKDHKLFLVVDLCGRSMSVKDAGRRLAHSPTIVVSQFGTYCNFAPRYSCQLAGVGEAESCQSPSLAARLTTEATSFKVGYDRMQKVCARSLGTKIRRHYRRQNPLPR
jgi:hypothetical protein